MTWPIGSQTGNRELPRNQPPQQRDALTEQGGPGHAHHAVARHHHDVEADVQQGGRPVGPEHEQRAPRQVERMVDEVGAQATRQGGKAHDRQQGGHAGAEFGPDEGGRHVVPGQRQPGAGGQGDGQQRNAVAPGLQTCGLPPLVFQYLHHQGKGGGRDRGADQGGRPLHQVVGDGEYAQHAGIRQGTQKEAVAVLQDHRGGGDGDQRPGIFDQPPEFCPVEAPSSLPERSAEQRRVPERADDGRDQQADDDRLSTRTQQEDGREAEAEAEDRVQALNGVEATHHVAGAVDRLVELDQRAEQQHRQRQPGGELEL